MMRYNDLHGRLGSMLYDVILNFRFLFTALSGSHMHPTLDILSSTV